MAPNFLPGYVRSVRRVLRGHSCECRECGEVFRDVRAFDDHRYGTYKPLNRKCYTAEEMAAKGMDKNTHGEWRGIKAAKRARAWQEGRRLAPKHAPGGGTVFDSSGDHPNDN